MRQHVAEECPLAITAIWEDNPLAAGAVISELFGDFLDSAAKIREPYVLRRRWGIDGEEPSTLAAIGESLGVSRERVRQIEIRAWIKILGRFRRHPHGECVAYALRTMSPNDEAVEWLALAEHVWPASGPAAAEALYCFTHRFIDRTSSRASEDAWRDAMKATKLLPPKPSRPERYRARLHRRFDRIMCGVTWPGTIRHGTPAELCPVRAPDKGEELCWASRKLSRDVWCDSHIEMEFFELCDFASEVVSYVEQPVRIRYQCCGKRRTYIPDALLALDDGRQVLVEVKLPDHATLVENHAKWDAAWNWCMQHGIGFLVTDQYRSLKEWSKQPLSSPVSEAELASVINKLLARGPITYNELTRIRVHMPFSHTDLTRLALSQGWRVTRPPWRLSGGAHSPAWL